MFIILYKFIKKKNTEKNTSNPTKIYSTKLNLYTKGKFEAAFKPKASWTKLQFFVS